ncbi:SGNH hydrolase [Actinomadura sp. NBRC 104425]|uniref:SGNH/GDSL hydrolase family protein n=1 Tax=Actinomadura sp. NBRC 104425 TaxID=3032204 RepID=UPI0024A5FB7F|nr:SGNH/GDSL hydrolase family protein [Actinomadura sp. NBRC 104425]GLZ11351.1 SGNH hydrolase [Actinomadura sp. NBRC 104425]
MKKAFSLPLSSFRVNFPTALLLPLAPVLLVQARRTARRTPRLDPASGADHGVAGTGAPDLRLVVIGDSTAVGVGAAAHAEALPGALAAALHRRLGRSVAWSVTGRSGATARRVATDLVPALDGAADLVVITVGINDLIRRRPLKAWAADLSALLTAVRGAYRDAAVLVAGMPPVHRFPALPQPLRLVIGARARAMDRVMREVALVHGAVHAPMDEAMARDRRLFAADGFHPSPAGYRAWADDLARAAATHVPQATTAGGAAS